MNILVISDLHIDNGDSFGAFGWKSYDFIRYIENIKQHYKIDQVILNGDIYELYKYTYSEISQAFHSLISYFEENKYIYIKGNHDILHNIGLEFYQIKNSKGQIIHVEHGHDADFLNGTLFGRFIARVGFNILKKLIRSTFVQKTYFRIIELTEDIERIPKKYDSYKYLKYALKLLKSTDVVILGHTHKIESHKTYYMNDKKRYLNCGSCSMGRFQAVVLDTETFEHETIKHSRKEVENILSEMKEKENLNLKLIA